MLHIRPAERTDTELIIVFIKALAEYENEPLSSVKASPDDLLRYGFDTPNPRFHALIAEWEGKPAGFAFYFYNFSTWEGKPGIYLEDVFVLPEFRKYGIGTGIMKHLATIALEQGCTRLVWQVLDWNKLAIDFYERIGAAHQKEWFTYRMDEAAMTRFVA
ncbi:MAG: GNAT family N-acetyltransferase [Candidatus Kapaibacterium sp.]|nr:MAG: GNAT family N-acetyltransferase [Candidatus Kapabacteria bacterium]